MNEASSDAIKTMALATSSEAEAFHRNSRHQSRLVLRSVRKTRQHSCVYRTRRHAVHSIPDFTVSSATDLVIPSTACLLPT